MNSEEYEQMFGKVDAELLPKGPPPYSVGEMVYVKKVPCLSSDSVPTHLINKQLKITEIHPVPCSDGEIWSIDLDGCEFLLTQNDITRKKPY